MVQPQMTEPPLDIPRTSAASVAGLLVPIVSSMEPIRRALRSTLRDSLDVYHSINQQTSVMVLKLQEMGVRGTKK
jgi:hypothetical protein